MPYDGEFAGYRSVKRIVDADRVKRLLNRAKVFRPQDVQAPLAPKAAPTPDGDLPAFVLAVDGSYSEVPVRAGYPGATVGYVTVASVLLDLGRMQVLDTNRPVDPREFRQTEHADTIDAAMPGSNVVTVHHTSARASFREELFDVFHDIILDDDDRTRMLTTYEELLAHKPQVKGQECPYHESHGCTSTDVRIGAGTSQCPTCQRPIFSTDALRIHERFNDVGSNGEAFGLVMQIWERILLVHLLRCFERRNLLGQMGRIAFFLDGPLGVFGPPAWLSAAISKELKRQVQISNATPRRRACC